MSKHNFLCKQKYVCVKWQLKILLACFIRQSQTLWNQWQKRINSINNISIHRYIFFQTFGIACTLEQGRKLVWSWSFINSTEYFVYYVRAVWGVPTFKHRWCNWHKACIASYEAIVWGTFSSVDSPANMLNVTFLSIVKLIWIPGNHCKNDIPNSSGVLKLLPVIHKIKTDYAVLLHTIKYVEVDSM